jgi:hypothetical protein
MSTPPAGGASLPARRPRRPRRSNWALRLLAVGLSGLAFLGCWQLAAHSAGPSASTGDGTYAPPVSTPGGLVPPSHFGGAPNGSTHVS